jgi:hypothetical protein
MLKFEIVWISEKAARKKQKDKNRKKIQKTEKNQKFIALTG